MCILVYILSRSKRLVARSNKMLKFQSFQSLNRFCTIRCEQHNIQKVSKYLWSRQNILSKLSSRWKASNANKSLYTLVIHGISFCSKTKFMFILFIYFDFAEKNCKIYKLFHYLDQLSLFPGNFTHYARSRVHIERVRENTGITTELYRRLDPESNIFSLQVCSRQFRLEANLKSEFMLRNYYWFWNKNEADND